MASAAAALLGAWAVPALATTDCPPGQVGPGGQAPCTDVPAGYYAPNPGMTAGIAADPGFYVQLPGQSVQQKVPAGRYTDLPGQSAAKDADPGYYVPIPGSSVQTKAPAGSFTPNGGMTSALLAQKGFYVPAAGSSFQTQAPAGYYAPATGLSAVQAADPGYFVPLPGMQAQQQAQAGFYTPSSGMSAALSADPGYYVANPGSSAQTAAPVGSYVQFPGQTTAMNCPGGSDTFVLASQACRATSAVHAISSAIVGPMFSSNHGSGGGTEALGSLVPGATIGFAVDNASTDPDLGNLTVLTLIGALLDGPQAALFELVGFTAGTALQPGDPAAGFQVRLKSGAAPGAFGFALVLQTDQNAAGGAGTNGDVFRFGFSGLVDAVTGVPEPTMPALVAGALAALAWTRRRRARPGAGQDAGPDAGRPITGHG